MKVGADDAIDALARRAMRHNAVLDWGLHQGMQVFGAGTPAAFLKMADRFQTASYSPRVAADCLLLAEAEDHYVRLTQFHQQFATLTGARSVTVMSSPEPTTPRPTCHLGNIDLSVALINSWLDQMAGLDQARAQAARRC
jgi:hypothetical protein